MQVEEFLERSARRTPDKVALVCGRERYTYAQIDADANRLAHGLIVAGVGRGDRVAISLDNSYEAVIAIFAALKAGGVFLMVNPTTKPDKLAYILNNSRARALICPSRKLNSLNGLWTRTPHLSLVVGTGGRPAAADPSRTFMGFDELLNRHAKGASAPVRRCINIDLAALVYTSGSTGHPKGVMLTHLNMTSAATSITTYLESSPSDVVLNVLPLSFDYGLYQLLMTFLVGGTLVLERSFTYPQAVLETLVREKVTGFPLVPTMLAILLQRDISSLDVSRLRYVSNTGAALPVEHIRRLRSLWPTVKIFSMYGLTECKRVSYLPPDQIDARPGSVGRGMPNEEVYLVDEQGVRLGPGSLGELVVRGANVMKGYWELPAETSQVLRPGPLPNEMVLYTGDLFRSDDEGYLYWVGRRDDIIKSRGEKVSPREVENVLCGHAAVAEAAVVGVPHPVLGQAIMAVVSLRENAAATQQELLRHCAAHLEDFMVPQVVEIRTALPRTGNGKIDKRELLNAAV